MSTQALYNVPTIQNELNQWSFNHADHHRLIARQIFITFGLNLQQFIIDPFNEHDLENWLQQHQRMHNDFNAVLGIGGNDLSEVKWDDLGERSGWIELNASEHYNAAQILGV